jgi:hypothetical protein
MQKASAGYCGDFPQPTTPFTGTAFTGPHSSAKSAPPPSTTGQTGAGAYTNPNLYAQPQGGQTPTTTTQTGGAGVPGTGGTGGGGGGGGGHGNGGGHHHKHG